MQITHTVPYKGWNSRDVAMLFLGIVCCVMFSHLLLGLFAGPIASFFADGGRLFVVVFSTFSFQGMAAVLVTIFLYMQKSNWKRAFGLHIGSPTTIIIHGIVFGLAAFPLSLMLVDGLQVVLEQLGLHSEPQEVIKMIQQDGPGSLSQKVAIGILSLCVAPIVEEVLFRGVLYVHLRDMGYPQLAMWGSAMLFGFVHGNSTAFIPMVLLAIFLTLIYEKYANLMVCMATHVTFNAANFILCLIGENWS